MSLPESTRVRPAGLSAKRAALVFAAAVLSVNVFTGAPLLALWVGSRAVPENGTTPVTMQALFVVVIVLAALVLTIAALLIRIRAVYDDLTGRPLEERYTSPWLRSLRGEREELRRRRVHSSGVEVVAMMAVTVAIVALEIWFFFFAHYSLPGGNG